MTNPSEFIDQIFREYFPRPALRSDDGSAPFPVAVSAPAGSASPRVESAGPACHVCCAHPARRTCLLCLRSMCDNYTCRTNVAAGAVCTDCEAEHESICECCGAPECECEARPVFVRGRCVEIWCDTHGCVTSEAE